MTDKPKTIQEALAKVQRNVDEDFNLPDLKKIKAAGAAAKQKISDVAQGVSDYINRPVKYNPDQPTIGTQGTNHPANVPASTVFDKIKSGQSPASTPATPKTEPAKTETPPKQETPKTEPAKTETPPAGSSAAKMSFNQAYAKAREMAKAAGKNPNIAQFKWGKDGGPEKTYQAAETKADYVTKNKQFAVDINAPSSTKKLVDAPLPPKRETIPVGTVPSSRGGTAFPADATGMPPATTRNIPAGSEGAKYPAEGGVRQAATGTFEKGEGYATIREPKKPETESGKKKMSEEHINELSKFGAAFAAARRAGQSEFSFGGKSFNTRLASSSPSKPSGPQGAPGLVGPGAKVTRLDAPLPPSRPNTQGPRQPAEQGAPIPKTDKVPGSSTGDATPRPSTTPPINQTQQKPLQSVDTSAGQDSDMDGTMRIGSASSGSDMPITRPEIVAKANKETNYSYESGGKKKKMSEESSPIIDMFLKLQEKHALTPNIFEAAKKAKKDYDGDDKVESEKDEYFGSRFAAAKRAGKMEEELKGNQHRIDANKNGKIDSEDFKLLRSKKKMEEEVEEIDELSKGTLGSYVKKASKDYISHNAVNTPRSKVSIEKKRLTGINRAADRLAKEEVEFSQAEIDHINSFLEAVAPNKPEPTKGVNPTVRNTDLTDETLDELKKPTPETALKVVNRANDRDEWSAKAANRLYSRYKKGYEPKEKKTNEEYIEEGRPRKNPTPETTERDAREHIQVQAGRAAGGTVIDFKHDDGKISKLTPGMGRRITAHLNGLKPAERQEAVKRMHASPEGLKV